MPTGSSPSWTRRAYLHFAGIKDDYNLVPIYERHAELTKLSTALALGETAKSFGRNIRELWRFACEGYLGNFVREEAERVAELEASLKADRRRRGDPVPDAPAADRQRERPRDARAARAGPERR